MTYEQLKNFITIVEVGSFKSASLQLHKSQPSLSVSIKKLEEELGLQLFSRDEYRPKLTPHGQLFYTQAKKTMASFYELEILGKELKQGVETQVSIALDAIVPLKNLGPALQRFFSDKKTELNLSIEVLEGSYALLEREEVDFAIAPILEESHAFKIVPLFEVEMIPVISKSLSHDPLRRALQKIPQIIVKSSLRPSKENFGVHQGKKWYVSDHSLKADLIKNSLGWGHLPAHLIQSDLQNGSLVILNKGPIKKSKIEIGLARKAQKPLGKVGLKLWNMIEKSRPGELF